MSLDSQEPLVPPSPSDGPAATPAPAAAPPAASSSPPGDSPATPPPPDDDSEALFGISLASAAIGALALMVAGVMYLTVQQADPGATFPSFFDKRQWILALGTGLFVLGVGLQANRIWELLYRRRSLFALNVILMSVLAIALTALVDYVTTSHFHEFDWTRQGVFTISDESVQVAKNVDKDIRIWVIFPEGGDSELVRHLVDHYRAKSARIEVLVLDPLLDREKLMEAIKELGLEPRTMEDVEGVIVQSGYWDTNNMGARVWKTTKSKRLTRNDFFESGFDPQTHAQGTKKFRGEQALTNALLEVTEEKKAKLYFLQGHGELDIEGRRGGNYGQIGDLVHKLRGKNYDAVALNILERPQKDVPDDASALVIAGPSKPYDPQEVAALDKYLQEGGKLFALIGPTFKEAEGPAEWFSLGIEPLLKKYNIELENTMIFGVQYQEFQDRDTGKRFRVPKLIPGCVASQFDTGSKITAPLVGMRAGFNEPRPVKVTTENPNPAAKASEILKTSPKAEFLGFKDPNNPTEAEAKAEHKPFNVMATSEQKLDAKPGEKERVTRVVVTGDWLFASNFGLNQGVNESLTLNAIAWLLGQERFTKEPVREGDYHLDISPEVGFMYRLLACPGIPFLTILLGVTVWIIRRR